MSKADDDKKRVEEILKLPPKETTVVLDHVTEDGTTVYKAKQEYPHVVTMYNPSTLDKIVVIVDKVDGKIIKTKVEYE
jgi:hypothetical protein